jgi:hypothetical protein
VRLAHRAIPTLHAKNLCAAIPRASVATLVRASSGLNAAEAEGATVVQIAGLAEGMIAGTTGVGRIGEVTAVQIVVQTVAPIAGETAAVDALSVAQAVDTVVVIIVDTTAEGTLHNAVHN